MSDGIAMPTVALLGFFAFLAGFIDAMVGGGGLIQLPAMLLLKQDSTPPITVPITH